MKNFSFNHWSNRNLLDRASTLTAQNCATIAELLAVLAEVEVRKLHLQAGYGSMFAWCMGELHFSEHTAFKRIRVARVARHFPVIFEAIADGRLHLTSVLLLSRHLTPETVDELVAAATHKSKSDIEQLLAERYPRPWENVSELSGRLAPERVEVSAHASITPIAPYLYRLEMALNQSTRDKLRHLQELLSHQIPSGNLEQVMEHALDLAIRQAEKRKFAAADRPRSSRPSADARHIPVEVQRAVWQRDGGQCAFVSETGRRCESRWQVEFDHVQPVANGGAATVDNVRLLCRAHNQFAAECAFGAGFMEEKRNAAAERQAGPHDAKRLAGAEERAAAMEDRTAPAAVVEPAAEVERDPNDQDRRDIESGLRNLGFRAGEACEAAAFAIRIQGASLAERMRAAISYLRPRKARRLAEPPRAA